MYDCEYMDEDGDFRECDDEGQMMVGGKAGKLDGRLNASRIPVIIAEPSAIVDGFLRNTLVMNHSKKRQDATDVAVTISDPSPNTTNDAMSAGIRATITQRMFLSMVSPQCTCGDVVTYSF